jgi:hypothetical protein
MTAAPILNPPVRYSVLSLIGFIVACASLLDLLTAKTLVPVLDGPTFRDQVGAIATALGILNLIEVVPIAVAVVFGHVGLSATSRGKRGRWLAIASLVLGYALLLLYLNRIIVSLIAVIAFPQNAGFIQNNFYWA